MATNKCEFDLKISFFKNENNKVQRIQCLTLQCKKEEKKQYKNKNSIQYRFVYFNRIRRARKLLSPLMKYCNINKIK